jgi:hypothetical protein
MKMGSFLKLTARGNAQFRLRMHNNNILAPTLREAEVVKRSRSLPTRDRIRTQKSDLGPLPATLPQSENECDRWNYL